MEEEGARFRVREYLEDPLSREELESLAARLGRSASGFVRGKESAFAASGCDADSDDAVILDAMAAAPILMERPILVRADRAVIGRPPEDVLVLLSPSSKVLLSPSSKVLLSPSSRDRF